MEKACRSGASQSTQGTQSTRIRCDHAPSDGEPSWRRRGREELAINHILATKRGEVCSTNNTTLSLQDALEYVQPQEADDEKDTVLSSILTFLVREKKDVARKTAEDEIGMFRAESMGNGENRYGKKEKEVVRETAENEIGMFGAGAMWNEEKRGGIIWHSLN